LLYLLDTNVLVHFVRGNARGKLIEANYGLKTIAPTPIISCVTAGEMWSLAFQFGWGTQKVEQLAYLLSLFPAIPIDYDAIITAYAVIDAHSRQLGYKMGKNDLWIAATTYTTGAHLLTTDHDFNHLYPSYFSRTLV